MLHRYSHVRYALRGAVPALIGAVALLAVLTALIGVSTPASAQDLPTPTQQPLVATQPPQVIQPVQPIVESTPALLERLSWGAILAGSAIALILQVALNLLGIGMGAVAIDPGHSLRETGDNAKSGLTTTAVWAVVATLIALFIGGYVAARMSGIPDRGDGLLHGLVTWAVVMLISLMFLTTALGRMLSGVSNLIGEGLHLATSAAGTAVHGAANVASGAAHLAGSAASGAAHVTANVAKGAARTVDSAAHGAAHLASDAADAARPTVDEAQQSVESNPEFQSAVQTLQQTVRQIEDEFKQLVQQVVSPTPEQAQDPQSPAGQVQQVVEEVKQHPEDAQRIVSDTLGRLFREGQESITHADRQEAIRVISQHTALSPQQARELIQRWDQNYGKASQEVARARQSATEQIDRVKAEAENLKNKAEAKVEDARETVETEVRRLQRKVEDAAEHAQKEAERVALEAIDTSRKVLAGLALAAFAAIVVGGIAAALGGIVGTPHSVLVTGVELSRLFGTFF